MEPLINFCEEKYTHSPYIYEFYNTVSNISYILAGLMIRYGNGNKTMEKNLYLIGVGSALFHGTGNMAGEIIDEVWILLTVCDIIIMMNGRNYSSQSLCIYMIGIISNEFIVFYSLLSILSLNGIYLISKKYGVTNQTIDIFFFLVIGKICWYMEYHFNFREFHSIWHILSAISLYHVGMLGV